MTTFALPNTQRIAYFTAIEIPDGLVGGLLLVDLRGRPIEFHCTTPLAVSRAEELLYGSTLAGFLHADCLGRLLLSKAKQTPDVLLVNSPPASELATQADVPLVMLTPAAEPAGWTLAAQHDVMSAWCMANDLAMVQPLLQRLSESIDINEPFARIVDAIRETHQAPQSSESADAA